MKYNLTLGSKPTAKSIEDMLILQDQMSMKIKKLEESCKSETSEYFLNSVEFL